MGHESALSLAVVHTVLDRKAVEERACECYAVVKKKYDRLPPDILAK